MAGVSPISRRLKEARLEAGMSQKQLGIAAGIDEFVASARMNQYETGKHVPDFSVLQQIAKVLNLPPAFFYTTDNQLARLIKAYSNLNLSQRNKLLTMTNKMISQSHS